MKKLLALLVLFTLQVIPQTKPELILPVSHKDKIQTVEFSPDGKLILSACWDNTAKLWDVSTGMLIRNISAHTQQVDLASFSPDGSLFLTKGWDKHVMVWETASGRRLTDFYNDSIAVSDAEWSPDGKQIVISTMNNVSIVMNAADGSVVRYLTGHQGTIEKSSYSPDGKYIITISWDQTARLYDATTGNTIQIIPTGYNWPVSAGFSPDSKYFYTSTFNGNVKLWNTGTKTLIANLPGIPEDNNKPVFSPDSRYIATANPGDSVFIWNTATGALEQLFYIWREDKAEVSHLIFTPDGYSLLTTHLQSNPVLWDIESGGAVVIYSDFSSLVGAADIAPDGSSIVFGDYNGRMSLNSIPGDVLREFKGKTAAISSVSLSGDGMKVAVTDEHNHARVIDAFTGKSLSRINDRDVGNWFSEFDPNGKFVVLSGYAGPDDYRSGLLIWNWENRKIDRFIPVDDQIGVFAASISKNGDLIATFEGDTSVAVYDSRSGAVKTRIRPTSHDINSVRFSPDAKFLISANRDSTATIYNVATGREIKKLFGHTSFVMDAVFSPDGKQIVTGSIDRSVRLWDVASGTLLWVSEVSENIIYRVFFSPDGKTILVFDDGKKAIHLDAVSGQIIDAADLSNNGRDVSFKRNLIVTEKNSFLTFYDLQDHSELVSLVFIDSTEWCVVHPSGLFDASPGAMEKMYYVQGLDLIEFGQLKEKYWEPGLFEKVMNGEQLRSVASIDKELKLWPEVTDLTFSQNYEKLTVSLKNQGGGIGKVQVFLNGKEMISDARGTAIKPDQGNGRFDVNIKDHPYLLNGENSISVVTWNSDGTLSSPGEEAEFLLEKQSSAPAIFVVAIGVADYTGDKLDLKYAAKDASDFMKATRIGAEHLFGKERTTANLLTTDPGSQLKPTRENIFNTFAAIAGKARSEDVIVVYLAGHGMNLGGEESDLYYLTQEAFSPNPEIYKDAAVRNSTTISGNELVEMLKKIAALKQVLIIDACASGKLVDNLAEKRDISGSIIRSLERMKDRTGLHIITGSAADAVSYEASKYGQGLLTYSLLSGMRGLALRDNRSIDIALLMQHAREMVPKLAEGIGGIQEPRIFSPKGAESFDIGVLDEKDKALIPLAQEKPVYINSVLLNADDLVDDLSLAEKIDDGLEALSIAGVNSKLIFWDVRSYPGALKLSGTYKVNGDKVEVSLKIIRDKSTVKSFTRNGEINKLEMLVSAILDEVTRSVK